MIESCVSRHQRVGERAVGDDKVKRLHPRLVQHELKLAQGGRDVVAGGEGGERLGLQMSRGTRCGPPDCQENRNRGFHINSESRDGLGLFRKSDEKGWTIFAFEWTKEAASGKRGAPRGEGT